MGQGDLTLAEAVASDLVFCGFCAEVYTSPLLLPCLHTFCHKCIVAMAMGERPIPDTNAPATRQRPTTARKTTQREIPAPVPHFQDAKTPLGLICPSCQAPIRLLADNLDDDKDDANDDNDSNNTDASTRCHSEEISDGDRSKHRQMPNGNASLKESLNEHADTDTETLDHNTPSQSRGNTPPQPGEETTRTKINEKSTPREQTTSNSHQTTEEATANALPGEGRVMNGGISKKKQLKAIESIVSKSLPLNYFLDSMARLHRHHNVADRLCVYCKTEDIQVGASSLCLQCQDDVCDACAKAHRKTRLTREHKVVPFESIQQGLFDHDIRVAMESIPCFDHPELCVRHFCPECQVVICKQCRTGNHRGHGVLSLTDAVARYLPEIKGIQEALFRSSLSMAEYATFMSTQMDALESAKESAITQIHKQTDIIIQMINDHKKQICISLEAEFQKEKQGMLAKAANARTSEHSNKTSSSFLRHLANLGNAQEQMAMYFHVVSRHKELVAARPDVLKSKLRLGFTPGPTTKANVSIIMGTLEAKRVAMSDQDAPLNHQLLSSLMPPVASPPELLSTITPSRKTAYPSGMACQGNMLALVDRENQQIQVFSLQNMKLVREFGGPEAKGERSTGGKQVVKFKKPFDLTFLPNGILAVTDPEASRISLCEWTGKFIAHFQGRVRHPRGITVNKAGEVIVVDGYLRQLTVHDATTGDIIRTIQPFRHDNASNRSTESPTEKDDQVNIETDQENFSQNPLPSASLRPPILIDPYYVTISNEGNLIVSDIASPNLKIFDPNGQLLAETMDYGTGPDQNLHPSGVCVDKHGYILVADTNNDRIHLGLPDGHMTKEAFLSPSHGLSHPVSLCLTQDGHLVIGQSGGQVKLYKYI